MLTVHAPTCSTRRAGFTLVELIITMVLVSFVAGAIVKLLLRQQRFYNSTTDLIQTRQQIRQAAAMLPSRSEEHMSELQSQSNLVCRLLLEKKKSTTY